MSGTVHVARVHDEGPPQGARVLVDRLWPRGVSKADADLHAWARDVAPSHELRRWYGHDPNRHPEFVDRYLQELDDPERAAALDDLRRLVDEEPVVLLTATRAVELSHATVLAGILGREPGPDDSA